MFDFIKSLAFWEALCLVLAALVAAFTDYKLEAAVLLGVILSVLRLFKIVPELRQRGLR